MSALHRLRAVIVLFVALVALPPVALAHDAAPPSDAPQAMYFHETGYWTPPEFAAFWQANGGLMTFGYPISRVFYQDGLHKQYFERAIFEHHEHLAEIGFGVQLVRLGAVNTIARRSEPAFLPREHAESTPNGLYFPETGQTLDDVFLTYWSERGGMRSFGYPISAELIEPSREDGRLRRVQYFERARFEHHPENVGTPFVVLLGHLGREALSTRVVPEVALTPQPATNMARDEPPIGPQALGAPSALECGFNMAFFADAGREVLNQHYIDLAAQSGCEWLRLQFAWSDLEQYEGQPLAARLWPYVRIVSRARASGLRLLVNVTHPPDWAVPADPTLPADPEAFAAFMGRLAARFAGDVEAWQVWNEPNLPDRPGRLADPAGFLTLLQAAYPAIKTADPEALVVFPGLAPTSMMVPGFAMSDLWYLERLLALDNGAARDSFDVLGMQGYGTGNHPDTYFPGNLATNPGWNDSPEFYFRHAEALRVVLVNAGLAHVPVWITETGWPAGEAEFVYGYSAWMTEAMQAAYLVRAFEIMRTEWHWVESSFVWHLNTATFGHADTNPFAPFSITNDDGSPRPAFDALVAAMARWADE